MEKIGGAYRRLSRQVTDPAKNEESLKHVATIRSNAEAALKLIPAKAAKVPEAERGRFVAEYEQQMKEFIGNVEQLEAALKAGNNEQAAALVKTLKASQDKGHKQFTEPKPRKKQ